MRVPISNGDFGLLLASYPPKPQFKSRSIARAVPVAQHKRSTIARIDVQILRLRRKIETNPARPKLIKTERGLGYRLCASVTSLYSTVEQDIGTMRTGYKAAAPLAQGI